MGIKQDLIEKRNERDAVNKKVADIIAECKVGNDVDLMKTKALGDGDVQSRITEMRNLKTRMDSLGAEVDNLVEAVKALDLPEPETKGSMAHPEARDSVKKSMGARFVESPEFKAFAQAGGNAKAMVKSFDDVELKTLIQTTAGFAPQAVRTGEVVPYGSEPTSLFDLIPKGSTNQAAYVYMRQTTRTQAAAEKSETGAYAESAFAWTQISATVEDAGHWVPITAVQLEDVPQIQGLVDIDLRDGIRERLDYQLYNGDGSTPNMQGGLGLSGINSQSAVGILSTDAIYKGITLCRKNGFADPNMIAVNGEDWETVQLMKTDDGQYIWGHPADVGPMRMWGVRVVPTFRMAKGTAFLGDFSKMLYAERVGITVEISDSHDTYFISGKYAIRARTRGVFAWKRPAAFCKVTGVH